MATVAVGGLVSAFTPIAVLATSAADFVRDALASAGLVGTTIFNVFSTIDANFFRQYRAVLVIVGILIISLVTGPFLRSETGFFMSFGDQVATCVADPLYQVVNKDYLFHSAVVYINATDVYNNFAQFALARGTLSYDAVASTLDCFLDSSRGDFNFQLLFAIVPQLWLFFGPLPFGFVSAPRQIREEPVTPGEFGFFFPTTNQFPTAVRRFEFDVDFQAQGPAEDPASGYPNPAYTVRDFWITASKLWNLIGELLTGVFRDLAYPNSRLLPSFYIDVSQENSIWRKAADIISTTAEFALLTAIWPYEFIGSPPPITGIQPIRDVTFTYIVPTIRIAAELFRFVSLVINDVLTLNRPLPLSPTFCQALPGSVQAIIERTLRGIPIVDFFIFPRGEENLNLFRSNKIFCEFMAATSAPQCGNIATNAFAFNVGPPLAVCPEWNGASVPLPTERINYVKEFIEILFRLIELFANRPRNNDVANKLLQVQDVVVQWLNFFIDSLIYAINAISDPIDCSLGSVLSEWFGNRLTNAAIATLELAFDDSCAAAIVDPASKRNIFLCFIAFSARQSPTSFWGGLCSALNFIPGDDLDLNCNSRKRSLDLGEVPPPAYRLTWTEWYGVYSPYYAHETRSAMHAFKHCLIDPESSHFLPPVCNTTCASRPCVDQALDCVQRKLIEANESSNGWVKRLERDSYWRTAARASFMMADTWFGCEDGDSQMIYRTINSTISAVRDLTARSTAAGIAFGLSHARCAAQADNRNSTVYLECIQMNPLAERWLETLQLHNITKETMCGAMLHEYGVDLTRTDSIYIACLTMLAYGSTAIAQGTAPKTVTLNQFLSGWTIPTAISASTENLVDLQSWNDHPRNSSWWKAYLIDGPVGPAPDDKEERLKALKDDRVMRSFHDMSSIAYAYFNYLADVYEHVMKTPTDGHTKDKLQAAMFRDRVASVGIAIVKQSRPVVASRMELAQRLIDREYEGRSRAGTSEIARFYGHSLMWVDRLYYEMENAASQIVVERSGFEDLVQRDALESQLTAADGSLVEMRIEPRFLSGGSVVMPPVLAMRAPRHWSTTVVLADYYYAHRNLSLVAPKGPEGAFSRVELISVVVALENFCRHGIQMRNSTEVETARRAAEILRRIDRQITDAGLKGRMVERALGEGAFVAARIGLRLLWNLVSRTLRIESMNAVQAALVVIDVITNGEQVDADGKSNLQEWLIGNRGYIIGVGYVEKHAYDYYMEQEATTRRVLTNGIFSPLLPDERNLVGFATVARRRMLNRAAMTRREFRMTKEGVLALPGKTAWGAFVDSQRARLRRRLSFVHRSKFLQKHGIEDEHLHLVIPEAHFHYDAVVNASKSANATERRVLSELVVANAGDNDFLYSLWDESFAAVGVDLGLQNARDSLFDQIEQNAADFFTDIANKLDQFFDEVVFAATCTGESDYRVDGTTPYRLGCLPFLSERGFNWYREYPADIPSGGYPYEGIFSFFVGPGYIIWPNDMIKVACPNPRVPSVNGNCPAQTLGRSLLNTPFEWLSARCFHNSCPGTSIPPEKPACILSGSLTGRRGAVLLIGCDYCNQTYFSAEEKGFTSGWINISVWSSAWRALIRNAVSVSGAEGFWYIVVLFILTEFVALLPGTGAFLTGLGIAIALFADFFITMTPERYGFFYLLLFALRAYGRGLAWIVYLVYVINLYPVVVLNAVSPLIGQFLIDAAYYLSPDVLLRYVFIFLRDYVSFLVSWIIDLETASNIIISQLEARLTQTAPSVSEFLYAFFSYFSIFETLVLFIPYILAVALLVIIIAAPAALIVKIGSCFTACGLWCFGIYTSLRLCCLRDQVEDQEDEIMFLQERIQRVEGSLKDR
jgi:hypothetical protein